MMNNNNFLVKALKARRKFVSNSNSNNNNNNKFKNKPGKIFTLSNATKQANKKANKQADKQANNTQHLFLDSWDKSFLKWRQTTVLQKIRLSKNKKKTINILLIKLKLAKGLLRQIKKKNHHKKFNKELMLSKYNELMSNENKAKKMRKSQRIKNLQGKIILRIIKCYVPILYIISCTCTTNYMFYHKSRR